MRLLAAAAIALALAACSGAPKKPEAPPTATAPAQGAADADQRPRQSPYAPAQEDLSKRGDYVAGGLYAPHIRDTAPDYIPDVDAIPEPEVVDEPRSRYGNRSPYTVLGKRYSVMDDPAGFTEQGIASYYGNKFHGRRTSNMEVYDMYAFTAAHKSLPLPSFARVTNLANGRSVVVRVNDRGPFHEGRVVDLSWAAAVKLDMHRQGTAQVEVRALSPGEPARHTYEAVATRAEPPAPAPAAQAPPPSAIDALVDALPIASAAAGERPAPSVQPAAQAPATTPAPAAAVPEIAEGVDPRYAHERRFNMMQNGRVMTADDFDAWLEERQIELRGLDAVASASAAPAPAGPQQPVAAVASPAAAVPAAPVQPAATQSQPEPPPADAVTLQVAAFGARDNAERALAMLQGAGIAGVRLVDGLSGGRSVWRVQVGPVAAAMVPELSARFAGLGFGQPQLVRD
ncbi:septal ring lytic transglycosylase RlpA family protein [Luteimonas dalianensis]|uniref:septal ring lytic transglycosylase RlpA family protein n=1 Tax=Luteimonas dalianensis TaxID=1148196 RepID=UPI003BF368F6